MTNPSIVSLLRCPNCSAILSHRKKGTETELICSQCPSSYPIRSGVYVLLSSLSSDVQQVRESYTDKWKRIPDLYDGEGAPTQHQKNWYLQRYHWKSEQEFAQFLSKKKMILDAGCGLGRDVRWYASLNPNATIFGIDLSDSVFILREKTKDNHRIILVQGDLTTSLFVPESFDFVACDQVLPCVANPREAVQRLWSLVKPGGHFAFYVYKKKSPAREFVDDYLRERISKLPPEEAWKACEPLTLLGKALWDIKAEVEIPKDIPFLGIKAGRYNLQRFFYYNFMKCFWNEEYTFDHNNLVNFDWYHPAFTYRHSVEEIEQWAEELEMKVLVLDRDDPSGISVLAQKTHS